ncbi:hypothetical protein AB0J71_46450 [Nonomuraea sp. NPDC049637]|uniref:hypothetical protein n=1 Tax=Nonomuraea sp. NPDC049637 TaxID=3154356 RepID=UPI003436BE2E
MTWALAWEMAHKQATSSPATLLQGYDLYRSGAVPARMNPQPGQISALITTRHGEPARATIRIAPLTQQEQRALAAALARGRHKNAVVKGQLPAALTDPAHTGDIVIVPGAAHLMFACDCRQAPCRHTAALGHAVAMRLHANPSLLLTLRGLPHRQLTTLLQAPDAAGPVTAAVPETPGQHRRPPRPAGPYIAAHQAYRDWDGSAPPPPAREASAGGDASTAGFASLELSEPPAPAPPLHLLRHLVTEASRQAQQLLTEGPLLETDPVVDAVRLTASLPAGERAEFVAHRLDMEPQAFRRLLKAYELAGAPGVRASLYPYRDDPQVLQDAAAAISASRPDSAAALTTADNRVTDPAADIEIRHGDDGRWYPFASAGHEWQLIALPTDDPASAYQDALTVLHARARPRR